jgi:tetratricopeptide (TPR) repeat protein
MDQAEKLFQQAITADAKDPSGHVGIARLELARGNSEQARVHFAEATKLGSDFFEALVYGGQALIQSGKAVEAIEGLEQALKQRPSHWDATAFLGQALIISGEDIERGIGLIRSAVNQRRGQVHLRLYEAIGYYALGDYNSSAQNFADVFVTSRNKNILAAVGAAVARSRQMEDDEVERWIGFVRNLQPQVADQLHELLIIQRKAIPLGFNQEGRPAAIGLTLKEEDAIIPVPKKKK